MRSCMRVGIKERRKGWEGKRRMKRKRVKGRKDYVNRWERKRKKETEGNGSG